MDKEKRTLRVAAQLTFRPSIISLVAEENDPPIHKGDIVKRVHRLTLAKMERPLKVLVTSRGGGKINNEINIYPIIIKHPKNENK